MVSIRKKIPVTGSFSKKVKDVSSNDQQSNQTVSSDSSIQSTQVNQSQLSSVLKDEPLQDVPKEIKKQTGRTNKLKKIVLYAIFIILLVSVISFVVTILRTIQNRSSQIDLNDKSGEIVWWGLEDLQVYAEVIEQYQKANPQAKIEYVQQPHTQYVRKLENAIRNGTAPDIFTFHNSWSRAYANKLTAFPPEVVSTDEFGKSYYPVIVEDLTTDLGIIGIPLEYDGLTLFVNEDIFLASGKDVPTRWDELRSLADDLTQRNSNGLIIQSGIPLGITENVDHWQEVIGLLLFQNDVKLEEPVGPNAQAVFDYYNEFAIQGVWDASLPPSTIAFAQGDAAMLFGTSKSVREIKASSAPLKFRSVGLPQIRKDDRLSPDVGYATYWVEGVSSTSDEKGLAFDFLKFISDPRNLQNISASSETVYGVPKVYPRADMSNLQINHPEIGSVVAMAPLSKSWYLADKTYDQPDGINAQVSGIYMEALASPGSFGIVDQLATELVGNLNQVINFITNPVE